VAETVAKAAQVPVTAKIRIGWDVHSINALRVCRTLEDCGMQAISIHGRTRSQGYSGQANWEVIAECAAAVKIPVVGNGDVASCQDVELRRKSTEISGVMIGRAAMGHPWIFQEAKHYIETGQQPLPVSLEIKWEFILRHCRMVLAGDRYRSELHALQAMRSRLMAYSKGLPSGKHLRTRFAHVASLSELEDIAAEYLTCHPSWAA
jgi:nifR3 family TIM-barrel protein